MSYTGWLLDETDRGKLLQIFPPAYHDVIAHHVTLAMGIQELPTATSGMVVGVVNDGMGIQALVIAIDGSTERWDGSVYHITWSIDRETFNRKPFHSNAVLVNKTWDIVWPIPVSLIPTVFPD